MVTLRPYPGPVVTVANVGKRHSPAAAASASAAAAKKDVADGVLDGPIKRTECTPIGGGSTDLVEDTTGQFSCIAVNKVSDDGTETGYRFTATVRTTTE